MNDTIKVRSPLKWAGGKYRVFDKVQSKLPYGNRLIEPFVGSGAIFLNADYKNYTLNDKNTDLINFYRALKKHGNEFIYLCRDLFTKKNNSSTQYYKFRNEFNNTSDKIRKSALFLYLNRHSYNGLCRYNLSGEFNVPFGRNSNPYFPEKELIFLKSKIKKAKLYNKDFESVMKEAKPGDIIYCDPPYVPISDTSNFTAYNAKGFSMEEQHRLAELAKDLARKGIPVLISNHATDFTKEIYAESDYEIFSVRRFISCNGEKRQKIDEILAFYGAYDN